MENFDILVIGNRVSASLSALFIKKEQPDLKIGMIACPRSSKLPLVGESLTEFSTQLLHSIGLTEYLEEEHFHKYGLTFYFKDDINNADCRTYAVHEALATPPLPSNQLNRFTFDNKLKELCIKANITTIFATASDYEQDLEGFHIIKAKPEKGMVFKIASKWLIDASGRSRFLSRKLKLDKPAPFQRSVSWFRLVNFDREKLFALNALKPKQQAFDSYFVTHHFMGKGNWIWLIPMRTREYKNMISIGMVWRPDICKEELRNIEEFISQLKSEHPVVAEFIESGEVLDFERYRNYMYESKEIYSEKGYYLIGDASHSVDPLYSTGMVTTSLQIRQVNELIASERRGELTVEMLNEFEKVYRTTFEAIQGEISSYYEVMHEPYQSHWRMHLISTQYFFFLLPVWLCGFMTSRSGVRFIQTVLDAGRQSYADLIALLPEIYNKNKDKISINDVKNRYDKSVNWKLWVADDKKIPGFIATLAYRFICFRFHLLKELGFKSFSKHIKYFIQDFIALCIWNILRGRKPRKLKIFKKLFGADAKKETKIKRLAVLGKKETLDKIDNLAA